jgi:hypothetical protein
MVTLVLGLRRSGTSLIARLLHEMGIFMGQRWLEPDEAWNPGGFYEDYDFLVAEKPILANVRFDGEGRIVECDPAALAAWRSLILDRCARHRRWGAKNFGLPYLLMEFASICPDKDIRVIVCRRPFNKCILSWWRMAHTQFPFELMVEKSAVFLFNLEQARDCWARKGGKTVDIDYETLIREPRKEVEALAAFCGVDMPPELDTIVDPRLNHF